VKVKADAVAPGGLVRVKLVTVSTSTEPAWLGVLNAKVTKSPAAKAGKSELFNIEYSFGRFRLEAGRSDFLRLPRLNQVGQTTNPSVAFRALTGMFSTGYSANRERTSHLR
jgi:hypothetical protein